MPANEPATTRYVFEDVDDAAPTRRCPIPEPFASGVRHAVPENDTVRLVTRRDVTTLVLLVTAAVGALLVGFNLEELWQLGGYLGLAVSIGQNAAAIALGASVVLLIARKR